jgi:hypothetical protein
MDKHQRKQLARWEGKKAKSEQQFQERMTQVLRHNAWVEVDRAIEAYDPPLAAIFPLARMYMPDMRGGFWELPIEFWPWRFRYPGHWVDLDRQGRILYDKDVRVEDEIKIGKQRKNEATAYNLAETLRRHQRRLDIVREELMVQVHRFRAIQACRYGFKEELMQVAWHPSRVGRILETYGWEALDNLLGVE